MNTIFVTDRSQYTTPRLMQAGVVGVALATAVMMLVTFFAVAQHRQALKAITKDSAPSIIAAQQMRAALADMDASLATELVATTPSLIEGAQKQYTKRRAEVGKDLVEASKNITYEGEQAALEKVSVALSEYERTAQRARDLREKGRDVWMTEYAAAAQTMDQKLLAAANELDEINRKALDQSYGSLRSWSVASQILLLVAGLLLLGALGQLQIFLSNRTRRTFNGSLLIATAVTFLFLLFVNNALLAAVRDLKVAKDDAFDSMHVLYQALSLAYIANAEESRYLLDPGRSSQHERAFFDLAAKVASSSSASLEDLATAARQSNWQAPDTFKGLLAGELKNITFEGEKEAASKTLADWAAYIRIDGQLRDLVKAGKLKEAVALCTGTQRGQSTWAFSEFDRDLAATIEINQQEFDKAAASGRSHLAGFEYTAPVAMVIVIVLTVVGLLPRLREYSA